MRSSTTESHSTIQEWRNALHWIVETYDQKKLTHRFFHLKLFGILVGVNLVCYWFAMATAFPEFTFGERWMHYVKMQLPLGLMAAGFEQLSVYITVYLMRHALETVSTRKYLGHLCFDVGIDFVIGFVAALWVIFSFTFSSWLVSYTTKLLTPKPQVTQGKMPSPSAKAAHRKPKKKLSWKDMTPAQRKRHLARKEVREKRKLARLRGTARDLAGKKDFAVYVFTESLQHPFKNWRNFYFGSVLGSTELLPSLLHFYFAFRALGKLLAQWLLRRLSKSAA